jgi:hypothetical protein
MKGGVGLIFPMLFGLEMNCPTFMLVWCRASARVLFGCEPFAFRYPPSVWRQVMAWKLVPISEGAPSRVRGSVCELARGPVGESAPCDVLGIG